VVFETADGCEPHFSGAGQHLTLEAAIQSVEAAVGETLRWENQ
jgi:hypothetical protein